MFGNHCVLYTLIARFMGQHGAHLGPRGSRWAPCGPQELYYRGIKWYWLVNNGFWSQMGWCSSYSKSITESPHEWAKHCHGKPYNHHCSPRMFLCYHFHRYSLYSFLFVMYIQLHSIKFIHGCVLFHFCFCYQFWVQWFDFYLCSFTDASVAPSQPCECFNATVVTLKDLGAIDPSHKSHSASD